MRRVHIPVKGIICGIAGMTLVLGGCAENVEPAEEVVALLEPVSVAAGSYEVERRDIYEYKIYSAICASPVEECIAPSDFYFQSYAKVPGDQVSAGDLLVVSDTTDLDERIEASKEGIAQQEEAHADAIGSLRDALTNAADAYSRKRIEEQIKENNELYDLDHARAQALLSELYDARDQSGLVSSAEGTAMAMKLYNRGYNYISSFSRGEWIGRNSAVTAIGNTEKKELRCDYISSTTLNAAEEVYALVNGERIEVEYQPLSTYEYKRLEEQNGTVYGCFDIVSGEEKVELGDYAVIVLVTGARRDVPAVPADAVFYAGSDAYVYVQDGESYKEKQIRCGLSDGYFTEVLSGLLEGDRIKSEYKQPGGASEAYVRYGDISSNFQATGYIFYATSVSVRNPVEYGSVYLDELCVSVNEQVEKGQVLAQVHVVSDDIEIGKTRRQIERIRERIAYLKSNGARENQYQISTAEDELKKKQEYLDDLNADAAVTEIKAPNDGMITTISGLEPGDLLSYKESICSVADDQSSFILVEDGDGKLSYGNTVTVSYKDESGRSASAEGMVVTANAMCLSSELQSGYSLVRLPAETVASIQGSTRNAEGWWSLTRVNVSAKLREMNHVLLLPKAAVHQHKNAVYVNVTDENGQVREQAFVAGGSDAANYWVVSGLEEGMRICFE